jgi:hypothetical protein
MNKTDAFWCVMPILVFEAMLQDQCVSGVHMREALLF